MKFPLKFLSLLFFFVGILASSPTHPVCATIGAECCPGGTPVPGAEKCQTGSGFLTANQCNQSSETCSGTACIAKSIPPVAITPPAAAPSTTAPSTTPPTTTQSNPCCPTGRTPEADGLHCGGYGGITLVSCNQSKETCDVANNICVAKPATTTTTTSTTTTTTGQSVTQSSSYQCDAGSGAGSGTDTAIGCVPKDLQPFLGFLLRWALGISGGLILIMLIITGYSLLTSQGNPEKLQAAKENLVSIFSGLILIGFSLVLLQVIGANVLILPTF